MNISSTTQSSGYVSQLLTSSTGVRSVRNDGDADDVQGAQSPAATRGRGMSGMGELMKKLDTLQSAEPNKFKQVTAEIGQQLQQLADSQSGPGAQHIGELASKFTRASESGTMDALKPPAPPAGVQQMQMVQSALGNNTSPSGLSGVPGFGAQQAYGAAAYARQQYSSNGGSSIHEQFKAIIDKALQSF